jgi:pyruvate-ferredoxin/flavodoxin oxidoreductase
MKKITTDGNGAAAQVAYLFSEVAALYPITPSSGMGDYIESHAQKGWANLHGKPVEVVQMQSEAGAAAAVHGALVAGSLATTFTSSQGLLLMIPNMYRMAGEMLPAVMHVAARSLAVQALSIFADHSDVMAIRQTGFVLLASSSVQEAYDMALLAHTVSLEAELPFLHFFDGFRTSNEMQQIEILEEASVASLLDKQALARFRNRALRPDQPKVLGAAQNADVYFQGREVSNRFYDRVPELIEAKCRALEALSGRPYRLYEYVGARDAVHIMVGMGSATEAMQHTVEYLVAQGRKVGLIKVRLYRPFALERFAKVVPKTAKEVVVLDRTKEPGSAGEPLYLDVVAALRDRPELTIIGGRYGLGSKELNPTMIEALFNQDLGNIQSGFTIGIEDDLTQRSIPVGNERLDLEQENVSGAIFWGFGSDGTVGACRQTVKLIAEHTAYQAQGHFVYDSKKAGGVTTSYLRVGKGALNYPYIVEKADYVACHKSAYVGRYRLLEPLTFGGVFVLNTDIPAEKIFHRLTAADQQILMERRIRFYVIDAQKLSQEVGLGTRINTIMQMIFFGLSELVEHTKAVDLLKSAVAETYADKDDAIIAMNQQVVEKAWERLVEVDVPSRSMQSAHPPQLLPAGADQFAHEVVLPTMKLEGDQIPVSAMPYDGSLPLSTAKLEKRRIAPQVPRWVKENCIQCNQCVMACPHAVIRAKQVEPAALEEAPPTFETLPSKSLNERDLAYRIQVYLEDCTGCGVCIETCPPQLKALEFTTLEQGDTEAEIENTTFFEGLPDDVLDGINTETVKGIQLKRPLFEFSGACAGCGETPYIKLLTLLYGEHLLIANATGCSSIFGGTFPTVPYRATDEGRGPAWANSLFEDNAEYGLGFRLAVENNRALLRERIDAYLEDQPHPDLAAALRRAAELGAVNQFNEEALAAQRAAQLLLNRHQQSDMQGILDLQDYFLDKAVWIIGGDGWAYDIGYGGVDHVLASGANVNLLVLDTEVYSNTGGQASKATPMGAVAKYASEGMRHAKKNLAYMAMNYGHVYVAQISMGANRVQTQQAFMEASAYKGPSLIIAYSPCIAHGIDMMQSAKIANDAVECGYWPLFRFDPSRSQRERFMWDAHEPRGDFLGFMKNERRFRALYEKAPDEAEALFEQAHKQARRRWRFLQKLGALMNE